MRFTTTFLTLLFILDPFGNIPMFLSLLKDLPAPRRRWIIVRELVIALAVLLLFLWFGQPILEGLGLDQPALQIAGGVILFLIAIRMIFPAEPMVSTEDREREPLIVPLAIPVVAGPSAMAYVILLSSQFPDRRWEAMGGLGAAWGLCLVILLLADALSRWLGTRVLTAIERLMGMILTTLAVQMLVNGLRHVL